MTADEMRNFEFEVLEDGTYSVASVEAFKAAAVTAYE